MENIIYGLGDYFWQYLQYFGEIISETEAFCDISVPDSETGSFLNRPLISPGKLPFFIEKNGNMVIYVASEERYDEISDFLISKVGVCHANIALLPAPKADVELTRLKREHYFGFAEPLKADAVKSAVLLADREAALHFMPKNAVICEVGVAHGNFTEKILNIMKPLRFFAIDYFSQKDPYNSIMGLDHFKNDNMPHQQWYENKFKLEIEKGLLETRQGLSWDCLAEFPDEYFDYIYVDASHRYLDVKRDVDVIKHKIKDKGYIQFNDYCMGDPFSNSAYGVITAVNGFVNSARHTVDYFCLQPAGFNDIVVHINKGLR